MKQLQGGGQSWAHFLCYLCLYLVVHVIPVVSLCSLSQGWDVEWLTLNPAPVLSFPSSHNPSLVFQQVSTPGC